MQQRLVDECNPEESQVDRRIVYELTGIMLEPHEFLDESSAEDDPEDAPDDGDGDRGIFGGVDPVQSWSEMVDGVLGAGGGVDDDDVSTPLT